MLLANILPRTPAEEAIKQLGSCCGVFGVICFSNAKHLGFEVVSWLGCASGKSEVC